MPRPKKASSSSFVTHHWLLLRVTGRHLLVAELGAVAAILHVTVTDAWISCFPFHSPWRRISSPKRAKSRAVADKPAPAIAVPAGSTMMYPSSSQPSGATGVHKAVARIIALSRSSSFGPAHRCSRSCTQRIHHAGPVSEGCTSSRIKSAARCSQLDEAASRKIAHASRAFVFVNLAILEARLHLHHLAQRRVLKRSMHDFRCRLTLPATVSLELATFDFRRDAPCRTVNDERLQQILQMDFTESSRKQIADSDTFTRKSEARDGKERWMSLRFGFPEQHATLGHRQWQEER